MFDQLDAQALADLWEALQDARGAALAGHQMFKVARLAKLVNCVYDAPAWDDRVFTNA